MTEITDFFNTLDEYLSTKAIIQQCIIKDYVKDGDKATCSVILPNSKDLTEDETTSSDDEDATETQGSDKVIEFKNVNCYIGSAIDITYENYMSGILIATQSEYQSAQQISEQKETQSLNYFNLLSDSMIAIIIPHTETLPNMLTAKLISKDSAKVQSKTLYLGDEETNLLLEMTNYLKELTDFFDKLGQNAPTISSYPADGSAKLQAEGMRMKDVTKQIYDKFQPITDYKEEEEKE